MAVAKPTPKILHEDEALLALDKPAGLLSHGEDDAPSALQWARERYVARGLPAENVHLVHRLDRDTSGVLLLAYSAEVAAAVNAMFRNRRVLKVYLALTSPVPGLRWQRVEHFLHARKIGNGEFMSVVPEGGLEATSEVEVLARGRCFGLVRVIPEQGRKHQVRVALAAAGAPICGDFLYGDAIVGRQAKRVMLHARALELAHPVTGVHLQLKAPLPPDFRALIGADGGHVPPDLDRRHRSEPKAKDRAFTAPDLSERKRAQAAQVVLPRSARPVSRPRKA